MIRSFRELAATVCLGASCGVLFLVLAAVAVAVALSRKNRTKG